MRKYKVGQILEELKITADNDRVPCYFEVTHVYDPPYVNIVGDVIFCEVEDENGNKLYIDKTYEIFIKPVESIWD